MLNSINSNLPFLHGTGPVWSIKGVQAKANIAIQKEVMNEPDSVPLAQNLLLISSLKNHHFLHHTRLNHKDLT